jgi:hypothetical protein
MRSVTYMLAAALLAGVGQFSAASAQLSPAQSPQTDVPQVQSPQTDVPQAQSPQTGVPQAQSPAQINPAASISDQKLDAAAAAMQRIVNLERDYLQLLEDASPDDQRRVENDAGIAIEKAITDQGLSVEEYSTIVKVAQNDPQVRQKIIERLRTPAQ